MKSEVEHACVDCYTVNSGYEKSDLGQLRCLECNGVVLDVTGLVDYIAHLKSGTGNDGLMEYEE